MFQATGKSAEVRVGGRVAATLGDWQLQTMGGGAWTFSATATTLDDFLMDSGGPFSLRVNVGKKIWRFDNVDIINSGGSLTVLGHNRPEIL